MRPYMFQFYLKFTAFCQTCKTVGLKQSLKRTDCILSREIEPFADVEKKVDRGSAVTTLKIIL